MSLRVKRIAKDYGILKKMYKEGILKQLKSFPGRQKSMDHLALLIIGPKGTPYEGGKFKLELRFGSDYPYSPPFMRLHTPIWHPNFWPNPSEYQGKRNICLALLDAEKKGHKDGWSPTKNIGTVIHSILAMLNVDTAYTNPHDVFNKPAAMELLKSEKNFKKKAKNINKKYAKDKW